MDGIGSGVASFIGGIVTIAVISVAALVIIGIWAGVDFFFLEDTYEVNKPLVPEMIIKSETRSGITTSDTTYIYHLD